MFFLCFGLFYSCAAKKSSKKIVTITVKKVSFNIDTFISVTCDGFEEYFGEKVSKKVFKNKDEVKEFQDIFNKKNFKENDYIPDVRAKIILLFSDGSNKIICISALGMLIDGQSLVLDKEILDFVKK